MDKAQLKEILIGGLLKHEAMRTKVLGYSDAIECLNKMIDELDERVASETGVSWCQSACDQIQERTKCGPTLMYGESVPGYAAFIKKLAKLVNEAEGMEGDIAIATLNRQAEGLRRIRRHSPDLSDLAVEFAQCRSALKVSRTTGSYSKPICFEPNMQTHLMRHKDGSLSVSGWVKKDKWVYIYLALRPDDSEDRFINGVLVKDSPFEPCPFCDTTKSLRIYDAAEQDTGDYPYDLAYAVICDASIKGHGGCGAQSGYQETRALAVKRWNERAGKLQEKVAEPSDKSGNPTYTLEITGIPDVEEAKRVAEEFSGGSMRWVLMMGASIAYPSEGKFPTTIKRVPG